ncbi:MAG: membrane protein insertase YidC [Nostocoides sp.]
MAPIEWLVAWIMYGWHQLFASLGMPEASGWTWGLAIVGLVVVMRAAMIPLFVKQIKAQRAMQLIQPEIQKIQKKYKGKNDPESRQAMTQETMALYKKEGTNPFSSCLPILLQSPFFFGLFRVLNGLTGIAEGAKDPIGPITRQVASQAESATIFGAQLSDVFRTTGSTSARIVVIVLIAGMVISTFTTQRQLMMKNMPASALDNPFAKQQKLLLYIMPFFFLISGVNFPIGVLIYWCTTNIWTMAQQFYVIRRNPTPGSPAELALRERQLRRGKAPRGDGGSAATSEDATTTGAEGRVGEDVNDASARGSGQRQQPKSKKRSKGSR